MTKKKKNLSIFIISIAVIILFGILAYLFPYSGDDWAWGSEIGIERLNSWFKDYNGRYGGNLVVIALTRIPLLKIACMAVSYYLTGFLSYKYSGSKKLSVFIFSIALFFAMPKEIFVQAVVWTSGYTNYVPPILMMIGYIVLIRNIFDKDKPVYNKLLFILTLVLGFAGALFMENLTLYSIAVAVLVILYCLIKYKKIFLPHITYFAGALGGAVMMFTNSSYGLIASSNDGYRSSAISDGNLVSTIGSHLQTIYEQLFTKNLVILGILTVLAISLCIAKLSNIENKKCKWLAVICTFVNVASFIILIFKNNFPHWKIMLTSSRSTIFTVLFFSAAAALYYISLSAILIIFLDDKKLRSKAIFLIISIPIIVAPLLVVSPIGPRCFFPPYMLLCMMATLLFEEHLSYKKENAEINKLLSISLAAIILASGIYYCSIYVPIHRYDTARNEYAVSQSQESDVVTICELPYTSYVWYGDPKEEPWTKRYKKFHHIDENVQFQFVKYYDFSTEK